MSEVVDTFAQYGKMKAVSGLVFAVSFAVLLSISGGFMVFQKKPTNKMVEAKVKTSDCSFTYDKKEKQTKTVCANVVNYTLDNQQLSGEFSSDGEYKKNDKVTLYENNKQLSKDKKIHPLYIGIGLISLGIIIVIIGYIQHYFTQKSTTYAALSGISGARSDLLKIF